MASGFVSLSVLAKRDRSGSSHGGFLDGMEHQVASEGGLVASVLVSLSALARRGRSSRSHGGLLD